MLKMKPLIATVAIQTNDKESHIFVDQGWTFLFVSMYLHIIQIQSFNVKTTHDK